MSDVADTYLCPRHGPTVRVRVEHPPWMVEAWRKRGVLVPEPVIGRAVLDTGADQTCIAAAFAETLHLQPIDTKRIHTPTTGTRPLEAQVYWGFVTFEGTSVEPRGLGMLGATLSDELVQGEPVVLLIGRDLLSEATFTWDGPGRSFTLRFPPRTT